MSDHVIELPITNSPVASAASAPAAGHRRSVLRVLLEVALIAAGVFLGLAGDAWRERDQKREAARASLHRFRTEIAANRAAVAAVRDYHVTKLASVRTYLDKPNRTRNVADVQIRGLRWVTFEHSAWDIALATQALAYIDGDVAYSLSRVYSVQQSYGDLTSGMAQAMYMLQPEDNFDAFAQALSSFFGDLTFMEPKLLSMYDELLPKVDRALGASGAAPSPAR
jgi:hypothetical protein